MNKRYQLHIRRVNVIRALSGLTDAWECVEILNIIEREYLKGE